MERVDRGLGVFARLRAQPGQREQLMAALRPLIDSGTAEEGTVAYIVHESTDDPDAIWFYARYRDQQALATHQANEEALLGGLPELVAYLAEAPQVDQGVVCWDKNDGPTTPT